MLYFIPSKAPGIYLSFIDGQTVNVRSYQGKPLLVTFWSITCSLCLEEIPKLTELYSELNPYGFEIIGIAMSYDPPNRVVELSKKRKIPYSIALDINSDAEMAFGRIRATPTNFLIDTDGKIVQRNIGTLNIKKLRSKIKKLLEILQTFVTQGNTVVVIEHNLDVIKTADWVIDMGPDGGINGGKIIAEGSPEKITEINGSYTGDFLKNIINSKLKKTA